MTGVSYRVLDGSSQPDTHAEFAFDVLAGLSGPHKSLPSRYFYDDEGSRLFRRIMDSEAYYPCSCEREILLRHAGDIASAAAAEALAVIDLGAGDGAKTRILLRALLEAGAGVRYVPVDISEGSMSALIASFGEGLQQMVIEGLVADHVAALHHLKQQRRAPHQLFLFLGSNVGNFDGPGGRSFLRRIWSGMGDGDLLLIGFDLKKDIDVLLHAYNDPEGLTAAFNLNLLRRINRELGGHFDPDDFRHFGTYDVLSGAMHSYLVSEKAHRVHVDQLSMVFDFAPWEAIHCEYSYKYLPEDITSLAADTGFECVATYRDRRGYFADCLWRASKS